MQPYDSLTVKFTANAAAVPPIAIDWKSVGFLLISAIITVGGYKVERLLARLIKRRCGNALTAAAARERVNIYVIREDEQMC